MRLATFTLLLLCLASLGCDKNDKALFDFRQRAATKVPLPTGSMVGFEVAKIQGAHGVPWMALVPVSKDTTMSTDTVKTETYRGLDKKTKLPRYRYRIKMDCRGKCEAKKWADIVAELSKAFTARGDIFTIIEDKDIKQNDVHGKLLVLERKINAVPTRLIYVWRWKDAGKAMYTCEVKLPKKRYWHYMDSFKTACLLNEPAF